MNLANITHETLSSQLGREIPQVFVVIAKHRIAGVDCESIAETIGCEPKEVEDIESDDSYKEVRQILGAMVAASQADQGLLWDSIESIAAHKLLERLQYERDNDFLLRAAATANRMTRRNQPIKGGILDPGTTRRTVSVQLTKRMVEKITAQGHRQVVEEKKLSIHDGSMKTPSFDEVDSLLGVSNHLTPKRISVGGETLSLEALDRHMQEKG